MASCQREFACRAAAAWYKLTFTPNREAWGVPASKTPDFRPDSKFARPVPAIPARPLQPVPSRNFPGNKRRFSPSGEASVLAGELDQLATGAFDADPFHAIAVTLDGHLWGGGAAAPDRSGGGAWLGGRGRQGGTILGNGRSWRAWGGGHERLEFGAFGSARSGACLCGGGGGGQAKGNEGGGHGGDQRPSVGLTLRMTVTRRLASSLGSVSFMGLTSPKPATLRIWASGMPCSRSLRRAELARSEESSHLV